MDGAVARSSVAGEQLADGGGFAGAVVPIILKWFGSSLGRRQARGSGLGS